MAQKGHSSILIFESSALDFYSFVLDFYSSVLVFDSLILEFFSGQFRIYQSSILKFHAIQF